MRNRTLSDILRDVNVAPQMHDTLARIVMNLGGGRLPFAFSNTSIANAALAAETVVVTTPPLNPGLDFSFILIFFQWTGAPIGTTGNGVTMQARRGTAVAGTLVLGGSPVFTVVAGNNFTGFAMWVDTPGAVAGQQYSGTISVNAATANSITGTAVLVALAFG